MTSSADPLADRLADWPAWRVLVLAGGTVPAVLLAIVVLVTVADATAAVSPLPAGLHQAVVGLPTVFVLYALGRRVVLRAPAAWFLSGRPDRRVLGWAAVGLAFPAAVLGVELVLLDARLAGGPPPLATSASLALSSLAAGLLAGVLEELALRGALLRLLEARWGSGVAVGASAATFALLHQGHADDPEGLALVLSSMLAAGLLLGVLVVRTRTVWTAVAVHAGWNTVFGGRAVAAATPGEPLPTAIWRFRVPDGPTLLAGGDASLGAAPTTTLALLAAAMVVARYGRAVSRPGPAATPTAGPEEAP